MCVSIVSKTFVETFFILRRSERHIIKNVYWSSCKVSVFSSYFKLEFSGQITPISVFVKLRPLGAALSHTDRRTERHDQANNHSSQFCKVS
jgi:hypothetical protein